MRWPDRTASSSSAIGTVSLGTIEYTSTACIWSGAALVTCTGFLESTRRMQTFVGCHGQRTLSRRTGYRRPSCGPVWRASPRPLCSWRLAACCHFSFRGHRSCKRWNLYEHACVSGLTLRTSRHADLKPENIFLASNITNRYPGYPTIKLGDFGLANIISHDGNRVLPPARYYQGTEKCRAPEQVDNTQPVNEQTNVWGIGVVMWGLMNSRTNALQFYTRTVDPGPPVVVTWVPTNPRSPDVVWSPDHVSRYSGVLRRLVLECLEPVPDDRPSPAILLATIRAATRSDTARDRASGLRNADRNDERWLSDAHSLKLSAERYPHHAQLSLHMEDAPEPDKTVTAVGPGGDGVFGPIPVGGVIHTE